MGKEEWEISFFFIKLQNDKDSISTFLIFLNLCSAPWEGKYRHQEFQMAVTIAESAENGGVVGLFNLWEKRWVNYCMGVQRKSTASIAAAL